MKIKATSFLGRLYRINFDLSLSDVMPWRTNLCHFIRVILIWLPLKIGVAAGLIAAAVVWREGTAIVGISIIIAASTFLMAFVVLEILWPRLSRVGDIKQVSIFAEYIKAKKQKICPLVDIEKEKDFNG